MFLILFLLFANFAGAQLGGVENRIDDTRDNLEGNITVVREFTERDKWNFIGEQWKEFLLKNKVIAGVDAAFTKVSIVFVVLFAKPWELSIEMLFVFMLWLFTVLSLQTFMLWLFVRFTFLFFFFEKKWIRVVGSILLTIAIAQTKIFNTLSAAIYKITFFKYGYWWKFFAFIACIVLIVIYFKLSKFLDKRIEAARKKIEEHEKELEVKGIKAYLEGLAKGMG